jgi:hypothetical protein
MSRFCPSLLWHWNLLTTFSYGIKEFIEYMFLAEAILHIINSSSVKWKVRDVKNSLWWIPRLKKPRISKPKIKTLLICFFDIRGVVHFKFVLGSVESAVLSTRRYFLQLTVSLKNTGITFLLALTAHQTPTTTGWLQQLCCRPCIRLWHFDNC